MMLIFSVLTPSSFTLQALWAVQEWNKKWLLIQRRKSVLQANLEKRLPVDIDSTPEKDNIAKNIFRFLEEAESEQAIDDCEAQFNLHFPVDESKGTDCGFKRPRFRTLYSIGQQAGLGKITKYFALTSEAFGDNVKAGYKVSIVFSSLMLQWYDHFLVSREVCFMISGYLYPFVVRVRFMSYVL